MTKLASAFLLAFAFQAANAQTLDPLYSQTYSITAIGTAPGVPANFGSMVFKDANTLWVSGGANTATGRFYSVGVNRAGDGHIASLGTGAVLGFGRFSDSGIAFGPGGLLLYTEKTGNAIAQVLPPAYASDYRTDSVTPLGVAASVGSLNFVPAGYQGAGQFKVLSHDTGKFYTIPLSADSASGLNLGAAGLSATLNTCTQACAPGEFVYVPLDSPQFPNQSMLVTESGTGSVGIYPIDANGNPIPGSRGNFIAGLDGVQLAAIDPQTGDLLLGTSGASNQIYEVRGFAPPLNLIGSIAHVATANGWDTVFTAVSLSTNSAKVHADFYDNNGAPLALPLAVVPAATSVTGTSIEQNLNSSGTVAIDATGPNQAQGIIAGWAQVQAVNSIDGFGIFRYPQSKWEALVPLETRNAASYLLAYDNTGGLRTGLALANMTSIAETIPVLIRNDAGTQIDSASLTVPAFGHTSFMLDDPQFGFPLTVGGRGTVEFDTPPTGRISVLGLRSSGPALTTLPVLASTDPAGGTITHIAYNAGFTSTFYFVNKDTAPGGFLLKFADNGGNPLTVPLSLPQSSTTATTSSYGQTLAPGAMAVIQTQADDNAASVVGSALLEVTGNVSGFEIFRWTTQNQEASVPLETRSPFHSFVLPFDNTNGLTTGVALVNLAGIKAATVTVNIYDVNGNPLGSPGPIVIPPFGHTSFMLTDASAYPITANQRGIIEFDIPSLGALSAIGLRAKSDGTLTTIPVMTR